MFRREIFTHTVDVGLLIDILRTYNKHNALVGVEYVVVHQFMGQTITERVLHIRIQKAVAAEASTRKG